MGLTRAMCEAEVGVDLRPTAGCSALSDALQHPIITDGPASGARARLIDTGAVMSITRPAAGTGQLARRPQGYLRWGGNNGKLAHSFGKFLNQRSRRNDDLIFVAFAGMLGSSEHIEFQASVSLTAYLVQIRESMLRPFTEFKKKHATNKDITEPV